MIGSGGMRTIPSRNEGAMKLCMSQATTMGAAFEDDLLAFGNAGWPAAELWLTKLEAFLQGHSLDDAREVLKRSEVEAVGAASQGGLMAPEGRERDLHWELFASRLKCLEALGVGVLVITPDFTTEPGGDEIAAALEGLARAANLAHNHGVRLALEFQKKAKFCSSLDTAIAMVSHVGASNLGVCLDLFHYYTGPSKFEDLAYLSPENLAWVQVSDLSGTPRELAGDSDRVLPGDGDFQIGPILEQLQRVGYDGYISLEVLNPMLWAIRADGPCRCGTSGIGEAAGTPRPRVASRCQGRAVSVSVVAIQPPAAIYREEQYFAWWLYAVLAAMVVIGWLAIALPQNSVVPGAVGAPVARSRIPLSFLVGLFLPPVLVVGVLRMTTEVTASTCRVWFGIVPTYRRAILLEEIRRVEIVRYRPIRDHGFWGVRTTKDGERIWTARGDRGVRVHLADGSRVLIGSQRPEDLAAVLDRAARPVG